MGILNSEEDRRRKREADNMSAFERGYNDAALRLEITENPFSEGTQDYTSWRNGWRSFHWEMR